MERWHDSDMCSNKFFYITSIRDPWSRLKSNAAAHPSFNSNNISEWQQKFTLLNSGHSIQGGSPSVDNWYIRSFLGKKDFYLPLGQITPAHLKKAKSI